MEIDHFTALRSTSLAQCYEAIADYRSPCNATQRTAVMEIGP